MAQNSQNDNSMDALWIAGIAIALFLVVQIWFGEQLSWVYAKIRLGWLYIITSVWEKENLMMAKRMLQTKHISEISSDQLSQLSKDLRFFMFPFWGALVGWFGYRVIVKNPGRRFRRRLTRQDLAREMSEDFPWTLPALQKDLLKESITKGEWAMAMTPLQFARKYKLLNGKSLDEKRAHKLFASQLGHLWNGPERLNPETKAIFACLAAQICRDKDGTDAALRELVVSITSGKPIYTKSNALLKKYANDPRVLAVCNRHAYQATILIAMFEEGKAIGIFPPNHFLWMRPRRRHLWYVLNCVMRRTYFAEVSGVYAHYLAEKVAGHAIEMPYTNKAAPALELALRDIIFEPDQSSAP